MFYLQQNRFKTQVAHQHGNLMCLTMHVSSVSMSIPLVESTGINLLRANKYLDHGPVTPTSAHLPLPHFQNRYYYKCQHFIISLSSHFPQAAFITIQNRQTPGKTYTHLSHLSIFPSYEWKSIQSLLLIEKK